MLLALIRRHYLEARGAARNDQSRILLISLSELLFLSLLQNGCFATSSGPYSICFPFSAVKIPVPRRFEYYEIRPKQIVREMLV